MEEKKKHKVMIGIEVILLGMILAIVGTNAASSNPPSNGVSYSKNSQTTVEGALNDLYNKANYGNASAGQILSGKTALVGGSKVTGTMPNNVSGTASAVVTYENSLYYRMPAGYYGGLGWGSEISATYTDVANAIGLTAGKLLKGESVLGITGTGETSCPSCPECKECPTPESQGYWKVYKFENLEATCESGKSGGCSASSWFASAKEVLSNCDSNGCDSSWQGWNTLIEAGVNLDYKEILGYSIALTCPKGSDANCIRISKVKSETGGADKTTSATYPSVGSRGWANGFIISSGINLTGSANRFETDSYQVGSTADNGCRYHADASFNSSKLSIQFRTSCRTNGGHWSGIELKGNSYNLSGYIIYR